MYYQKLDLVIFFLVSLVPFAFLITYLLAVFNDHVAPGFPYISDTGTLPPESCVFGQFLAIGSFIMFIIVYVRYYHVRLVIQKLKSNLKKLNTVAYVFGLASSFGISMVGNFQETNLVVWHLVGAALAFLGLYIYLIMQTVLSFKLASVLYSSRNILIFRILLIVSLIVLLFLCPITGTVGASKQNSTGFNLQWTYKDGGYVEHLISTSSEWIYTLLLLLLLLTFSCDFRQIKIKYPDVEDSVLADELLK